METSICPPKETISKPKHTSDQLDFQHRPSWNGGCYPSLVVSYWLLTVGDLWKGWDIDRIGSLPLGHVEKLRSQLKRVIPPNFLVFCPAVFFWICRKKCEDDVMM